MPLLKLRIKGHMVYIPTREIVEVKEEDDVTTVIFARNGMTYRTNDRDAVLSALAAEDALLNAVQQKGNGSDRSSILDMIFGKP